MTMEKIFIVGEKKYDKGTRQFKVFYPTNGTQTTVGTSDTTVYDVPSNKTFLLRGLILRETSGAANTVTIKDSSNDYFTVSLSANEFKVVELPSPIVFTSDVLAVAGSASVEVTVLGEETEL